MSYRPYQKIERRKSRLIHVGRVPVGGDSPISVQTMTNTPTEDAAATIAQIQSHLRLTACPSARPAMNGG